MGSKTVKLKFSEPAKYNGKVVFEVGVHDVPVDTAEVPGWAARWIARGAKEVTEEKKDGKKEVTGPAPSKPKDKEAPKDVPAKDEPVKGAPSTEKSSEGL